MFRNQVAGLTVAAIVIVLQNLPTMAQGRTDRNLSIMLDAARQLEYALPENRTYLLIKRTILLGEQIVSPVAVVFGYVDNHDACEQIAVGLSAAALDGSTFECDAIQ
jgi:hypothetical protein